jgi:hypothetical protein
MNKFERSIVLLSEKPNAFQAEGFAADVALQSWESISFDYSVTDTLPSDLEVDTADQLLAFKRDAGPNAVFLIIHNKE